MVNILIVEDQEEMAELLVDNLEMDFASLLELNIDIVTDGSFALEKISQKVYDLIFLDLHLPIITGNEFMSLAKSYLEVNTNCSLIVVTGAPDEILTKQLPYMYVLTKPYKVETFQRIVKMALKDHLKLLKEA
jgi:CheY-like chemotaxis protein